MKKLLFIIGTRPEAIKLAPLIHEAQRTPLDFELKIIVTGQHQSLLHPILAFFDIQADYTLQLENTSLSSFAAHLLLALAPIFEQEIPDAVIVQGDTSSAYVGALAAFYQRLPVVHIEAGLRTFQRYSPFPEELNRVMISRLASWHCTPTSKATHQLLQEGIAAETICESGNTVIDALFYAQARILRQAPPTVLQLQQHLESVTLPEKPMVLVTVHRRENFGERLLTICRALRAFAQMGTHQLIFPVHPNPKVQEPVYALLEDVPNITLLEPLPYEAFVYLLQQVQGIITDSGGIQEEATALGIPTIVLRQVTERSEALASEVIQLCAIEQDDIIQALSTIGTKEVAPQTIFGTGQASKKIIKFIDQQLPLRR
ncbi:MAG: UDP-N-acetylglucosamine 2-epimerase (non-hydrolyzing) [Bacteroidota bacterium]